MRNLKKFLALVLAMMMVFGLMVTANASSLDGFQDVDDVNPAYEQAMEVIAELGVLQGLSDTVLDPTGPLQRNMLATILYRMYTGNVSKTPEESDSLLRYMKETQVYDDVPAGEWFTGPVNYATSNGWLNGYGNYYGPYDTLTVVQALSGMMRMMDLEIKSTGNWAMDTLKAADKYGLLDNLEDDVDLTGPATREIGAVLALSALTYDPDDDEPDSWQVKLTQKGKDDFSSNKAFLQLDGKVFETRADAILNITLITQTAAGAASGTPGAGAAQIGVHYNIVEYDTENYSLGWDTFKLSDQLLKYDPYGRPATVYTKGNTNNYKVISMVLANPKLDNLDSDSLRTLTGAELYNVLGNKAEISLANTRVTSAEGYGNTYTRTPGGRKTVTTSDRVDVTPYGGNGVSVEIYSTSTTNAFRSVVIVPTLARLSNIRNYKETATEGAYTQYVLDGVFETLKEYTSHVNTSAERTNVVVDGSVARGDYVIVYHEKEYGTAGAILDTYRITPVDTVTGVISRFTESTESYLIGGKSYLKSYIANCTSLDINVDNLSHTFILDDTGNVVAQLPDNTVTGNYIFVLDDDEAYHFAGGTRVEKIIEVTGINQNGEMVTLPVSRYDVGSGYVSTANKSKNEIMSKLSSNPTLMQYAYNASTGRYDLYSVNAQDLPASMATAKSRIDVDSLLIGADLDDELHINGTTYLVGIGATIHKANNVYANAGTKYFVAVKDTTGTSKYVSVKTYVGYAAMGNITSDASGKYGAVVDVDGDGVADLVFIDDYSASGTTPYAYLLRYYVTEDDTNFVYDAIVDGKPTTVILTTKYLGTMPALVSISSGTATALDTLGKQGSLTNIANMTTVTMSNKNTYSYKNGSLVKDAVSAKGSDVLVVPEINADVPVYIFDNGSVRTIKASEMRSEGGPQMVFVVDDSHKITAIYIVEDYPTTDEALESGTTDAEIKQMPDGLYVPADNAFQSDMAGLAKNNVIFKFSTIANETAYKLEIKNASDEVVYEETGSFSDVNAGHYFYITLNPLNGNAGTLRNTWVGATGNKAPAGRYSYTITGVDTHIEVAYGAFSY